MRWMIFDSLSNGHHPEYWHHLYMAVPLHKNDNFIFVIPEDGFRKVASLYNWPNFDNVSFNFITDEKLSKIKDGLIKRSFTESRLIARYERELKPDKILLVNLATTIPFLPILSRNAKIRGIIYNIYLWSPKKGLRGFLDKVRYNIMVKNKYIEKIFLLNDEDNANYLNNKFKTDKFRYLADPVEGSNDVAYSDIRNTLGISPQNLIFLHFGALSKRKGTIEVLKGILEISNPKDKTFIFAGRIDSEIKEEFDDLTKRIKNKGIDIHILERFIKYSELHNLCEKSDCILMPYSIVSMSSGNIAYASIHNTPVIAPAEGLVGNLIKKYKLGVTIHSLDYLKLAHAIENFKPLEVSRDYADSHSVSIFQNSILE